LIHHFNSKESEKMTPPSEGRPTWAEIDLDALAFNLRSIRQFVGGSVMTMAVVKADAYGHGAVECSRQLAAEGIDWLGVALPEEGIKLRDAGMETPILSFGNWPGQESMMLARNLTPVVFQLDALARFDAAAAEKQTAARVHIKIDTGMGRVGVRAADASEFARELKRFRHIEVEGLMTHFAAADEVKSPTTIRQISQFADAVAAFHAAGVRPRILDLANSPGAIVHPESRSTMVRIGGLLYGLGGDVLPKGFPGPELRPVMSVHTKVSFIKQVPAGTPIGYGGTFVTGRESLIATLPVGYHDGLPRALSNTGHVLIGGKLAPIVGRVSMDWTTVDVTDVSTASVGSDVTLIGRQESRSITAEEIAETTGTISYEITCGLNSRVEKVYNHRERH
jgi:alanine racemase